MNKYNINAIRKDLDDCIRNSSWRKFRKTFEAIHSNNAPLAQAIVECRPRNNNKHSSLLHALLHHCSRHQSDSHYTPLPIDIIEMVVDACPHALYQDNSAVARQKRNKWIQQKQQQQNDEGKDEDDEEEQKPQQHQQSRTLQKKKTTGKKESKKHTTLQNMQQQQQRKMTQTPLSIGIERGANPQVIECLLLKDRTSPKETLYTLNGHGDTPLLQFIRSCNSNYDTILELFVKYDAPYMQSLLIPSRKRARTPLFYVASQELRFLHDGEDDDYPCYEDDIHDSSSYLPEELQYILIHTYKSISLQQQRHRHGNNYNLSVENVVEDQDEDKSDEDERESNENDDSDSRGCDDHSATTNNNSENSTLLLLVQAVIACSHLLGNKCTRKLLQFLLQEQRINNHGFYGNSMFQNFVNATNGNTLLHEVCNSLRTSSMQEDFHSHKTLFIEPSLLIWEKKNLESDNAGKNVTSNSSNGANNKVHDCGSNFYDQDCENDNHSFGDRSAINDGKSHWKTSTKGKKKVVSLMEYLVAKDPESMQRFNHLGETPLHAAIKCSKSWDFLQHLIDLNHAYNDDDSHTYRNDLSSSSSSSHYRSKDSGNDKITICPVSSHPSLLQKFTKHGELPLHLALKFYDNTDDGNNSDFSQVIMQLWKLYPEAARVRDNLTCLYPFQLAAVARGFNDSSITDIDMENNCNDNKDHYPDQKRMALVYFLLRSSPDVIQHLIV